MAKQAKGSKANPAQSARTDKNKKTKQAAAARRVQVCRERAMKALGMGPRDYDLLRFDARRHPDREGRLSAQQLLRRAGVL